MGGWVASRGSTEGPAETSDLATNGHRGWRSPGQRRWGGEEANSSICSHRCGPAQGSPTGSADLWTSFLELMASHGPGSHWPPRSWLSVLNFQHLQHCPWGCKQQIIFLYCAASFRKETAELPQSGAGCLQRPLLRRHPSCMFENKRVTPSKSSVQRQLWSRPSPQGRLPGSFGAHFSFI